MAAMKEHSALLGSCVKALEALLVLEGIKPAARLLCQEKRLQETKSFLANEGLAVAESGFKVLKDSSQGFYADRSTRVERDDPRTGHVFLYLSKTPEKASEAKSLEEEGKHAELGRALGYPECCCAFFKKHFREDNADLTMDVLDNSDGFEFPWHANIAARHLDVSLLSHFPCSFQCKESIALAKKNIAFLEKNEPQLRILFEKVLKAAVLYTSDDGVFILQGHSFDKETGMLVFQSVLTTTISKLYYLLNQEKKVNIEGKHHITIGEHLISGRESGVMIFY